MIVKAEFRFDFFSTVRHSFTNPFEYGRDEVVDVDVDVSSSVFLTFQQW